MSPMMRFPFVPRSIYDQKCADYDALLEKYHAELRAKVAPVSEVSPSSPRVPKPPRPPRDAMVDRLTADLRSVLTDDAAARAEAERIAREAFGAR